MMKDHEIAKVVNDLRAIAIRYHSSQQLREQIANVIVPILTATAVDTKTADESDGSWAAFDKSVHAQMSNRDDLWPVWLDAWFAARTDAVEKETMALEEAARTGFFGLLTRAQIVEALEIRDASIADETHVASAPAVEKEASGDMNFTHYDAFDDAEKQVSEQFRPFMEMMGIASPTVGDSAGEPVGAASNMPGTDGFTMVCFKASDVPVGTKLYANLPAQTAVEPVAWMLEKPKESGGWFTSRRAAMELCVSQGAVATPLYAHPPVQTADVRAMTDEQIIDIYQDHYTDPDDMDPSHILPFARALLEHSK
jgi:hypothetical protein